MHGVSRWARRVGGSLLVSMTLLLALALPAAADASAPRAEADLMQTTGLPIGAMFWGVAGAAALIVGWAMTRRPRGARTPEKVLATD